MRTFQELIASHEDWLVGRTLEYAKRHGYTRYSSTLLEAWRQSVAGLSAALIAAINDPTYQPELAADADYTADAMTAFGVEQARRHRTRGTELTMFLALLKYYRQSYLDLIAIKGAAFNLGLSRLAYLAEALERKTAATPPQTTKADIAQFLECLTRSMLALEDSMRELTGDHPRSAVGAMRV